MRRSGKYAYVDGVPCTQGWNLSGRSSVSRYSASCVPGGTATVEGNQDWTGSVNGVGYLPLFPTEDPMDFIGVASAKAGQIVNYEGEIVVSDATINIPVAAGGVITWTSNFGMNGIPEKTTTTAYVDETREHAGSAKWGKIAIETTLDSGTFTPLDEVQSIGMTFRRAAATSVNDGATYRDNGNLEADLTFQINSDDLEVVAYELNAVRRVRVYVTETLFYLFDSIQFSELSNFQVVRDPPTIISYQVNGMWTGLRPDSDDLGQILLPGGGILFDEES